MLVNASLRVRIALHADRLAWAFARARIGGGALAAHRQTAQVTHAAIALDGLQPLEVHAQLAAKVAFDHVLTILDGVNDFRELRLVEVLCADARVNPGRFQDIHGVLGTDAVDVAQGDIDALVGRDFYTNDACHILYSLKSFLIGSALPLLVTAVGADHPDDAFAADDLAVFAKLFD